MHTLSLQPSRFLLSISLLVLMMLPFSLKAEVSATPINTAAETSAAKTADAKTVDVVIVTSMGKIEVELNAEKAPISVDNFLQYVESGFYDDTVFHRVINNFMVQGGGFDKFMRKKSTRAEIKNEAKNGLRNDRGTLAMARTSVVDSASSQFFINHKDNDFLNHGGRDYGYAVFGKVTKGMDVVDAIARVRTKSGDVPINPVMIKSVRLKIAE